MDDFDKRSMAALQKLFDQLQDEVEVDLEGGVLTIEFDDDSKFLVNQHGTSQQIWLSANMSASHFAWHEPTQSWRDTRTGAELFTELGRLVSEKLAEPVKLRD